MPNEKWTPGPWQRNGSHIYGPDPERKLIAQVLAPHEEYDGCADLIIAAPELYEALNETIQITGVAIDPSNYQEVVAIVERARKALRKAEGLS